MATPIIVVLSALAYLIIGHQIAISSVRIWRENFAARTWGRAVSARNQKRSLLAFLLFPLSCRNGELGIPGVAPIHARDHADRVRNRLGFTSLQGHDPRPYMIFTLFSWPLRLLWNLPFILVFSFDALLDIICRRFQRP